MKLSFTLAAALLLAAQMALAQGNIVEVASANGLTTLLSLVTLADLAGPLTDGAAALTVLAPTNAAFANLPEAIVETLTKAFNKDWLTSVLTYHVFPARYDRTVVASLAGGQSPATLQGSQITVTLTGGNLFLSPAVPNPAQVVATDVPFLNGQQQSLVHVINAVLVPPNLQLPGTITDIVVALNGQGQFTILLRWLQEFGDTFTDLLSSYPDSGLTVFAPTDAAARQLPARFRQFPLRPACKRALNKILRYHVVRRYVRSSSLRDNQRIRTIKGLSVRIDRRRGGVFVDDAKIIQADVRANNGIIHVIDEVLMP